MDCILGRENLNVSMQKATECINRLRLGYNEVPKAITVSDTGCLLAAKARNKGAKGWIKMKIPGSGDRQEHYIHHLALIAAGRRTELEDARNRSLQVSHLCHNPACFNEKHLIIELQAENLQRNKCKGWTWIAHPAAPELGTFNPCQHLVKCILPQR